MVVDPRVRSYVGLQLRLAGRLHAIGPVLGQPPGSRRVVHPHAGGPFGDRQWPASGLGDKLGHKGKRAFLHVVVEVVRQGSSRERLLQIPRPLVAVVALSGSCCAAGAGVQKLEALAQGHLQEVPLDLQHQAPLPQRCGRLALAPHRGGGLGPAAEVPIGADGAFQGALPGVPHALRLPGARLLAQRRGLTHGSAAPRGSTPPPSYFLGALSHG
mmetsp:Transcript_84685/g.262187  ORF Transcript_84685/g.262187 Transcript_84685/m.262187 type:complete len:214 (+) Transcript_84685:1042-1683(+)